MTQRLYGAELHFHPLRPPTKQKASQPPPEHPQNYLNNLTYVIFR